MKRIVYTGVVLAACLTAAPAGARAGRDDAGHRTRDGRTALPYTASPLPLVGLGGLVALGGAVWLTRRRNA